MGLVGCFGRCKNCILYAVGLCRVDTMVLVRSLRRSSLFDQYMEERFIKIMWRQVVVLECPSNWARLILPHGSGGQLEAIN